MNNTKNRCAYCPYRWQDEEDDFPTCHFEPCGPDDQAPCEYDD